MKCKFSVVSLIFLLVSSSFAGRDEDFRFAQRLFTDNYFDLAAEQFANFIKNYPDDFRIPTAYYMRGKALMEIFQWEEARIAFLRLALEYSDSKFAPEALYQAGHCLKNQNRWKEAARTFLSVSDYYSKNEFAARGMVEAGIIYRLLDDDNSAKIAFERITRDYPGTVSAAMAYFNLAEIAQYSNDDQQALQNYQLANRISEDPIISAITAIRLSLIHYRKGEWETAESELNSVTAPPEYAQYADIIKGVWAQKRGDYETASRILATVIKNATLDTLKQKAELHLGDNFFLKNSFLDALNLYRNLPSTDSLALRLGLTYQKLDSVNQAVEAFAQVLKCTGSPSIKILALEQLQKLYPQSGLTAQISNIISSYLPNLKRIPHWDSFAVGLGCLAFQEGNFDIAEKVFATLDSVISPWSDDALFYKARIAEINNNAAQAINFYQDFLQKYPGSDFASQALSHLTNIQDDLPNPNLVEEIARLSSSSLNFKTKGELALNWGKLYYDDFKDYYKASEQLNLALKSQELTYEQTVEALGLMAHSLLKRSVKENQLNDSLRTVMQLYLRQAPHAQFAGKFSLYLLQFQVSTIPDSVQAQQTYLQGLQELLARFDNDPEIPHILAEIIKLYSKSTTDRSQALQYCLQFQNQYPHHLYEPEILLISAQVKLELADSIGAKKDCQQYIQDYPNGSGIFTARRKLAELTANPQDKLLLLKDLVSRYYYHSQIPQVLETLGDLFAYLGSYTDALNQYLQLENWQTASSILAPGSDIKYKIACTYQRMGNLLEAQEYYLDYAVNNPDGKHWGEAILGLAEISESLDRAPVALKFYQDLVTRGEKNQFGTTAIKRMADIYYRIGRYSEGVDLYRQLANNDTSSEIQLDYTIKVIIGLYRQGLMESAQSEVTAFTKKYKKSPQLPNCQAIFLLEKAKAQAKEKNFNEALTTLQLVSTKYPKSTILPEVEYEIGKIQLITNHFEEALGILSNMPNKYPNHEILPSVYLTLGTYYYRQSDFQNALLSFQEVLDNTQGRDLWPTALKNLELTYKDLGLYEAALSIVNRYLELFPYSEDALLKRLDAAQILLQLRDYDRAIQRLQDLLPLASQEMRVEAQFYLGEAYFQKGDFSQAVLEYMKVKYLDPGGGLDWAVTAIYNAGICYEKLGKLEEAKKMYQDIISRWGVNSDYGKGAKKRIDFLEQLKK